MIKKSLGNGFILLVLFTFVLIIQSLFVMAEGTCNNDNEVMFRLYTERNSHLAVATNIAAPVKICYNEIFQKNAPSNPLRTNNQNLVINISDTKNAHISVTNPLYSTKIYYHDLKCYSTLQPNIQCTSPAKAVISYSDLNNAHASKNTSFYPYKLCCSSPSAPTSSPVSSNISVNSTAWKNTSNHIITQARTDSNVILSAKISNYSKTEYKSEVSVVVKLISTGVNGARVETQLRAYTALMNNSNDISISANPLISINSTIKIGQNITFEVTPIYINNSLVVKEKKQSNTLKIVEVPQPLTPSIGALEWRNSQTKKEITQATLYEKIFLFGTSQYLTDISGVKAKFYKNLTELNQSGSLTLSLQTDSYGIGEITSNTKSISEFLKVNFGTELKVNDKIYFKFINNANKDETVAPSKTLLIVANSCSDLPAIQCEGYSDELSKETAKKETTKWTDSKCGNEINTGNNNCEKIRCACDVNNNKCVFSDDFRSGSYSCGTNPDDPTQQSCDYKIETINGVCLDGLMDQTLNYTKIYSPNSKQDSECPKQKTETRESVPCERALTSTLTYFNMWNFLIAIVVLVVVYILFNKRNTSIKNKVRKKLTKTKK